MLRSIPNCQTYSSQNSFHETLAIANAGTSPLYPGARSPLSIELWAWLSTLHWFVSGSGLLFL